MKTQDIRDKSDEQLGNDLLDLRRELYELKNELAVNHKLEKPHLIRAKKREKAQILTILTERKKGINNAKK